MRTPILLALALTLPGCAFFGKARDTFDGLVNPLVGLGLLLSVAPSEDEDVDLSNAPVQEGTTFTLMLVDAAHVNDLDQAPVTGAAVSLHGEAASEIEDGTYLIAPGALAYDPGATWELQITRGASEATAQLALPATHDEAPPREHSAGADLIVDLSGEEYDSVLVMVIDPLVGDVTWSNQPETPREVYDFTRGDPELVVTIPGDEAFPDEQPYLVGIAGMNHTGASDLDGMNTIISTLMAGQMVFHPVSTIPVE